MDSKVNDEFCKWAKKKCGSDELNHVLVTRGKTHDYLGIILECSKKHHVGVSMKHYFEDVDYEFQE